MRDVCLRLQRYKNFNVIQVVLSWAPNQVLVEFFCSKIMFAVENLNHMEHQNRRQIVKVHDECMLFQCSILRCYGGLLFIVNLQRTIKLVWIKADEYLNFSFPEGPVAHKDSTAIIMQCPCQYLTSTSTTFIHLLTDTGKLKLGEPLQFVSFIKRF